MANFLDTTGLTRFWGDVKIFLQSRGAITLADADKMLVFDDSVKEDINGVTGTYGKLKNLTIGNLKTYLATYFAPVSTADAMTYKGAQDCSANPNYPAANAGDTYKVSVAGKIGGASGVTVEAGDMFICTTDGTASGDQATVGTNWNVIQTNLAGAISEMGTGIHALATKATPVDADELALSDSAASWVGKKFTWANLKSVLKTYFDTLYALSGHNHTVDSLSNVVITSNSDGEFLVWDTATSKWINQTIAEAGVAASGHNHDAAYAPIAHVGATGAAHGNVVAAGAAGFMTGADKTKLDGIEAGADVTDGVNVGSAMWGAAAKTTPLDADTMVISDTAASNVIKKVTFTNIKAFLKTYFDTLYSLTGHTHAGVYEPVVTPITNATIDGIVV